WPADFTLRHDLRPGDVGAVVSLHGTIYAREYGFDPTFEAYVAGPLAEFVLRRGDRDRLWLAEGDGRPARAGALVAATEREAQLRWYLVDPQARGRGLGAALLREAVDFCRERGFASVFLWTVSALQSAARLYRTACFRLVEEVPGIRWGVSVV